MFCSVCGSQVEENAAFCPNCGAAMNGNVQQEDNSSMQEYGNAAASVQDGYAQIDGTMELAYHPFNVAGIFMNRKAPVYVDNYYVTASGNSIDRAHISGTKRGTRTKLWKYFAAFLFLTQGIGWVFGNKPTPNHYALIPIGVFLIIIAPWLLMTAKEEILIIKGSGSADAITISTDAFHRRELDPIEEAVRALAASYDRDTNVRLQGAMNRAHSEYQTDRIIDAINRK